MEIVLIRIDHFRDRAAYLRTLRSWLQQTEIANGRLISQGTLLLLFLAAPSASQVDALLSRYQMDPIDTNARNEVYNISISRKRSWSSNVAFLVAMYRSIY